MEIKSQQKNAVYRLRKRGEGSGLYEVSPTGAFSTMQVEPYTAANPGYGVRPARDNSPEEYNRVGREYSDALLRKYGSKVIAAAGRGERIFLSRVYDASDDGRKIFDVTAIIGAEEKEPDADKGARAANLRGLRRWPVARPKCCPSIPPARRWSVPAPTSR